MHDRDRRRASSNDLHTRFSSATDPERVVIDVSDAQIRDAAMHEQLAVAEGFAATLADHLGPEREEAPGGLPRLNRLREPSGPSRSRGARGR